MKKPIKVALSLIILATTMAIASAQAKPPSQQQADAEKAFEAANVFIRARL